MKKLNKALVLIVVTAVVLFSTGLVSYADNTAEIIKTDDCFSLNSSSYKLAQISANVLRIKYGVSHQGRSLEAYLITNKKANGAYKINTASSVNVRSGAGTKYKIICSLKNGAKVTVVSQGVKTANGYKWDKIITGNGKTGYVVSDYVKFFPDKCKTLLMTFAVHGFEDEYYRDGKALVKLANKLVAYFSENSSQLKNYRLVIVPCVNPDGTLAGKNNKREGNDAFGRCTFAHIDINRDFGSFKSCEARALRDFIKECKPDIYLDVHGWLNEVIGEKTLNAVVADKLSLSTRVDNYPKQEGYIIDWVHKNLNIPASLIEFASSDAVSCKKNISMIKAIAESEGIRNSEASDAVNTNASKWKNGSTSESVYKLSNLTQKTDTLKPYATASCYGKIGDAYIISYLTDNSCHKSGFVKYSGGSVKCKRSYKKYKNGSTKETVYADTDRKTVIGSLNAREECKCICKLDGMYLVVYNVSGSSNKKCGFVSYSGGC